jgi:alkylation response protein AidB-like acyl-CoA dehydrogenase
MPLQTTTSTWYSEEHRLYTESVRKFFADQLAPNIQRWIDAGIVDRDFWVKAGEAGILGAAIEEAYGGAGAGISFDAITIYEQARCSDSGWGFGIQSIVIHYIRAYGTEDQKARWLPKLATGEMVAALAMTEPGGGSDVQSVRTSATKTGNEYLITGSKTFITNGQTANLICLAAKTDKDAGASGVSLIMVETDNLEGFRRGKNLSKLGLKAQDTTELFFEDARVPKNNLLGIQEGQGFYQLMNQLPWERLLIGITALGAIDFALEETTRYVRERKAFGTRVMDFQNTRFKLAEMKTKAEVTRSFLNDGIQKLDAGILDASTASMAKWWGSQTQCEIMDECVQLHGGYGYMMEYPITRLYADARVQKIYGGTNEIMKELIARSLDV